MGIEIFDNFLLEEEYRKIHDTLYGPDFLWGYSSGKSYIHENKQNKYIFQFVHSFYMNYNWKSPHGSLLEPFIRILKPVAIFRIKANLTTITPKKIQYEFHRDPGDVLVKCKTACYYVNTNNGKTVFSDGQEIDSIANRLIVFDSDMYHTGTSCTDESTRCVINFNYFSSL